MIQFVQRIIDVYTNRIIKIISLQYKLYFIHLSLFRMKEQHYRHLKMKRIMQIIHKNFPSWKAQMTTNTSFRIYITDYFIR